MARVSGVEWGQGCDLRNISWRNLAAQRRTKQDEEAEAPWTAKWSANKVPLHNRVIAV
jgi:hypothetical protein